MKNKQSHFLKGSFALLLFMILGYVVKFYPENVVGIDQPIQSAIRGDLPAYLTDFFTRVTVLMNTPVVVSWVASLSSSLSGRNGIRRPSSSPGVWLQLDYSW